MNAKIGLKIRTLRKQKGISQEEAANHLHMSQSAYARIENGESNSWATHLERICSFFEFSPEDLLKNDTIIVNQSQKGGNSYNAHVIHLSEKLIAQYEKQIADKEILISELRNRIKQLEN